jgi:DNA polymerase-3 subunit beta
MATTSTLELTNTSVSFKISQESFYQAISQVSRAVAKHGIQPVLSNILIQADAETKLVTLAATDLDLALAVSLSADVQKSGEITVPATKTTELIAKLPHLEMSFSTNESGSVTIACGRSKFEIRGLSSDQFPKDFINEVPSENNSLTIPIKHLQRASHLVSFASDKREVSSILNGICFEMGEKGIEIAATDGSRLAYYQVNDYQSAINSKVIVPFRTVNELSRMIANLNEDEEFKCFLPTPSKIVFKSANKVLSSSLIDGTYPKYQQLIPSSHNNSAILARDSFLAALERVSVLANERTRVVKLLFEEAGTLTISANTPDLGEALEQLDLLEYTGQDFSIAFNVSYMSECLRNLEVEKIELQMSEPLKPIIVNPIFKNEKEESEKKGVDYSYSYLLMPIQMKGN